MPESVIEYGGGLHGHIQMKAVKSEVPKHVGMSGSRRVVLPKGTLPYRKLYENNTVHVKFESGGYNNERNVEAWAKALGWEMVPEVIDNAIVFIGPESIGEAAVCTRWLADAETLDSKLASVLGTDEYHLNRIFEFLIGKGDAHGQNTVVQGRRVWSIDHGFLDMETMYDKNSKYMHTVLLAALESKYIERMLKKAAARPLPAVLSQRVEWLLTQTG